LSQELPALLAALESRFEVVVARVSLSATVWDATPEQVAVGDRVVQVAWFRPRRRPTHPLPRGNPAAGDQWSSAGSTAVVDLRCGTVRSPRALAAV